jgi:hypothetical protein
LAERTRDKAVIETLLNSLQIKWLLSSVYGQQNAIDASLNQLEVGGQTVILYNPTRPILFTSQELIHFGFDREQFEALPS